MPQTTRQRSAWGVSLAARLVGMIMAGIWLLVSCGNLAMGSSENPEADEYGLFLLLLGVIPLIACLISWASARAAGVLLVVSSLMPLVRAIIVQEHFRLINLADASIVENIGVAEWLVFFGGPHFVAGVLFLLSWRLARPPNIVKEE